MHMQCHCCENIRISTRTLVRYINVGDGQFQYKNNFETPFVFFSRAFDDFFFDTMNPTTRADIFFTTVCCLLVLFFQFPSSVRSVAAPPPPSFMTPYGTYVSSYDHMDVGRLLKNDKLVTAYMRCFLNQGPCTVEGRQVKGIRMIFATL